LAHEADVAVVVDVLSFTTSVTVALEAGATVLPYPWRDDSAATFAERHGAVLAVGRSQGGTDGVSLSPAGMRANAPAGGAVVLPSPNGSTIAHRLASGTTTCVAACLRNADAVADWVERRFPHPARVAVVAAGERWPDDSLRPAVEDLWGAGAVLSALAARGRPGFSPEARAARATYDAIGTDLPAALHACVGGQELDAIGFGADVDVAAEVGASSVVPVLRDGAFVDAAADPGS
jgi:2-phosphosulfolactate phosphatase